MKTKHRAMILLRVLVFVLTFSILILTNLIFLTSCWGGEISSSTSAAASKPGPEPGVAVDSSEEIVIEDAAVPLAPFPASWSMVNLLVVVFCIGMAVLTSAKRLTRRRTELAEEGVTMRADNERYRQRREVVLLWHVLAVVVAVAALIIFLLAESFGNPMQLVDRWTPLMLTMLLVFVITMLLAHHGDRDMDDDLYR